MISGRLNILRNRIQRNLAAWFKRDSNVESRTRLNRGLDFLIWLVWLSHIVDILLADFRLLLHENLLFCVLTKNLLLERLGGGAWLLDWIPTVSIHRDDPDWRLRETCGTPAWFSSWHVSRICNSVSFCVLFVVLYFNSIFDCSVWKRFSV
jgi:hypothetical protein